MGKLPDELQQLALIIFRERETYDIGARLWYIDQMIISIALRLYPNVQDWPARNEFIRYAIDGSLEKTRINPNG